MMTTNGIAKHVGNIIATMTKREQTRDLYQEVIEEMETDHLHVLIQKAFVKGNYLIVINKAGREIRVSFDQVPALKHKLKFRDRLYFEIQYNGSCLYWKAADIHLDFESLLYYVDEAFRAKVDQESANRFKEYGAAIRRVRLARRVGIDCITGIKTEDVQDIESGELRPETIALTRYADALGLELNEFLNEVAVEATSFKNCWSCDSRGGMLCAIHGSLQDVEIMAFTNCPDWHERRVYEQD